MPRATRSARSCRPPLPPARSCTPTGGTATPACGRWVTSIVRAANAPRRSASGCCRARTAPSPTARPGCTAHTAAPHPATCRPTSTSTSFATTDAAPPTPPSRPCSASVPDTSRPPTAGSSIRPPDPKRNEPGTHYAGIDVSELRAQHRVDEASADHDEISEWDLDIDLDLDLLQTDSDDHLS